MALNISNDSKNSLAITNDNKPSTGTFGDTPGRAFADEGTFGVPGLAIIKDSKNSLSISNDSKS